MNFHVARTYVVLMILIPVQVCVGVKVLRDWDILSVNSDAIISEVFQGLCMGQVL